MFYRFSFAYVGLLATMLASCGSNATVDSNDVNPEKVDGSYSLTYLEEFNTLVASAQFRLGGNTGTTLLLTDPAKVEFDGRVMRVNQEAVNLNGTDYILKDKQPSLSKEYKFIWTRDDSKTFVQSMRVPSAVAFASAIDDTSAGREKDFIIPLKASPAANEKLSCRYEIASPNESGFGIGEVDVKEGACVFPAKDLQEWKWDQLKIWAVNKIQVSKPEGHLSGTVIGVYRSKPVTVHLTR